MLKDTRRWLRRCHLFLFAGAIALATTLVVAQTTVGTGSIVGTVTDPSGAVVSGARVTITNTATGQVIDQTTNSSGAFNSGAVSPGSYKVSVTNRGFSTTSTTVNVLVGNTATANMKLQVGQESQTIEVQAAELQVNTEQATVQGVLNANQIENLPVNGRNFLDLAQLEPGVQIQDGQNFDPTKAGYSSISFGGRFGRTARINVDGVDVSDETVGTTTSDIPASAIDEFQMSQSTLDLSNDLTSSGAVNVTTKSGTNAFHGQAFEFVRDHTFNANVPGGTDNPFQRHQFGGRFGGPLIKNKAFFFLDGERTKQDSFAAVLVAPPLDNFSGGFSSPFRENNLLARLDYDLGHGAKAFYRYSYFSNLLGATFGLGYEVYNNKDYTRNHVAGIDFTSGNFTHSIRFSYLKFQNGIVDATLGNNALPLCCTGLDLKIGTTFFAGPNHLAPQATPQSNRQIKYDGSKAFGKHILRYGVAFNHIQGGGFANFYDLAPRIRTKTGAAEIAFANQNLFGPGGASNPLNYPVERLTVGDGLGFNTEHPALGFPAGGLGPDNRLGFYIGDAWKIRPNMTINAGLRYDRDTGRTDSDLGPIPELNAVLPGMGNRVRQANLNFAPQLGIAWDPRSNGKTVIRAGIGLFYENVIYNNVLFDRPLRLRTGAFNQVIDACNTSGVVQPIPINGGQSLKISQSDCGIANNAAIGNVAQDLIAFQHLYQSLNPFDLNAPNPNFIGNFIQAGANFPLGLFAPQYQSPRSLQMNVGIQREIRHGMVFSADYLRNVTTHLLLNVDVNKAGDVSTFNSAIAANAIDATNATFKNSSNVPCGPGTAGVTCAIAAGATIDDYAGHGLTSQVDFGGTCLDPNAAGGPCAFGGINQSLGQAFIMFPIGRSVYNGLQMKLSQNVANPFRGLKNVNFQVAYSLSRFENSGAAAVTGQTGDFDQDFVIQAADNVRPNRYFGPSLLDRTHQISFGGFFDMPYGFRFGLTSHFYSPLSSGLYVPVSGGLGEIFKSDFTGDGTVQDPLPGTHQGQFDRGIDASQLAARIANYNTNVAGSLTPAGQAIASSGLMTQAQLVALGASPQQLATPPAGQVNFSWLRAMDMRISWKYSIKERFTIEPSIAFYNVANFNNFSLPPNTLSGLLSGDPGTINGTNKAANDAFRVGNGTGVYSLGSPRELEWGLTVSF
jgi:hypothetical protein